MNKKYLSVSLMFFVSVFLFSQELILKLKNPANIISWVYQKERLENSYCVCDNNYIIFASSTNKQKPIIHIHKEHKSPIISSSFYISNAQFVVLDDENTVLEAKFSDLENVTMRKVHENLIAKSIAISPNNEMVATGFANGFVQIHYLLKRAKKNFDVHFKAHNDSIYSVHFNSMGQYFITSGEDERIKIWDAKTLTLIKELSSYSENLCPAIFSQFDDNFVYCSSQNKVCVSDIAGNLQREITVTDGISLVKFTEKKNRIAILTNSKRLEFYNIATGQYEGTIPSPDEVNSFDINIITGAILLGTEKGEVYLSSNREIKNTVLKESTKEIKKVQTNKIQVNEKTKTSTFSTNMLGYLALEEEEEEINESQSMKPFFPIKDETPLEAPITFSKTEELIKKKPTKISVKTLDESILDDEIEFQENETIVEEEEASEIEEEIPPDDEAKNKNLEDESNQDNEQNQQEQESEDV